MERWACLNVLVLLEIYGTYPMILVDTDAKLENLQVEFP